MYFSNYIIEILAAQTAAQVGVKCPKGNQLCNVIAEIGKKKVAEIWGGIKKKSVTSIIFLQHFHNKSQVFSYY